MNNYFSRTNDLSKFDMFHLKSIFDRILIQSSMYNVIDKIGQIISLSIEKE